MKQQRRTALGPRWMSRSGLRALVVAYPALVMCWLLAACGGAPLLATPDETVADKPMVSCEGNGAMFSVSALIDTSNRPDYVASALERLVEEAGIDAPTALRERGVAEAEWFVLDGEGNERAVAVGAWDRNGPIGRQGDVVYLRRSLNGWDADGWGDCLWLSPVLARGEIWVEVRAPVKPDPSARVIAVEVSESECVSGRDPMPFLREPEIVEDEEAVTVFWTSEAPTGAVACPGNPWVKQELQLSEPLGDRELLDGSTWPPARITDRQRP